VLFVYLLLIIIILLSTEGRILTLRALHHSDILVVDVLFDCFLLLLNMNSLIEEFRMNVLFRYF